jgi:hypothetical protein
VQVILRAQSPLGGWRYHARPDAGQDTSVTAMVFVSLASARQAGILVPTETIDRVVGYLRDQVWNEKTGGFGYHGRDGSTLACTGGGAYAAQLCGMRETEWVQASIRHLENSPKMFNRREIGEYYYAHYYAMQAMVQAGDEHYAKWYPQIRDSLINLQKSDGSWNEDTAKRAETYPHKTPMSIIILGTPHRYIRFISSSCQAPFARRETSRSRATHGGFLHRWSADILSAGGRGTFCPAFLRESV